MLDVTERFLKYVSVGTNSDEECEKCPSSPSQLILGKKIADDMVSIGLQNVRMDEHGYVYGFLPGKGSLSDAPALGFISHMDTSPSVPGDGIRPEIVKCSGKDIPLASGKNTITLEMFPDIAKLDGEELIVTDGTTLLGADDKAGVA
ncbi:MAG: peptidase T, partial [Clostridia bacterium]|nr:peptidase T [Clostridia bacterium]